ncbi:MAG TPA: MFS transporter [Hellea balneolensis]|uniref:MFS transporter n=1 Tax=Hellea balneolensis TaxID=287478 RepID=A0A7C5M1X1_9PROT|nr:MFS transporter [Hellea balneolensis]
MSQTRRPLLLSRRFLPLFLAQIAGAFNDQFLKLALITLVTWKELSMAGLAPDELVPMAGWIFTAPFFLFSAMAGQVADKYDKALVLLRVKQAEILIMLLAAAALVFNIPWLMLVCVALMGAQSAFFSPTRNSVLPQWLGADELVKGNALLNGFVSVAVLFGQALGIFLITMKGGPDMTAAILLVFAVIGWLAIRQAPPAPSSSPDIKIDFWIFPTIFKTLAFAANRQNVFRPMLGTAWYYWLVAAVLILMPIYIKGAIHYERTVFIVIMVLFTVGALAGAMLTMALSKLQNTLWISAAGALGIIAATIDLFILGQNVSLVAFAGYQPATDTAPEVLGTLNQFFEVGAAKRFMADLVLSAFSASLFVIPLNALAQGRAEPKHRARLLAAGALLLNASTTISQMVVQIMNKTNIPIHYIYVVIAAITTFILVYVLYRARILGKEMI